MMNYQEEWQDKCPNIQSRLQKILETRQWADCRFLVGAESNQILFSAHKFVLAVASPVFERMFFGNLRDESDPIVIPDITPHAFNSMMEYVYTDETKMELTKVYEIYYAAKKYILPFLVQQCLTYMIKELNPTNVCKTYEFGKLFEESYLKTECLKLISVKTNEVLKDKSFCEIELSTLSEIFKLDPLLVDSELDLFDALHNYATKNGFISSVENISDEKCKKNLKVDSEKIVLQSGIENSIENSEKQENKLAEKGESSQETQLYIKNDQPIVSKRAISDLEDIIHQIRFLSLTAKQFSEIPMKSDLLTESESLAIVLNILSNVVGLYPMPKGFSTSKVSRRGVVRYQ